MWRVAEGAGLATVPLVVTVITPDDATRPSRKGGSFLNGGIGSQIYNLGLGVLDAALDVVGLQVIGAPSPTYRPSTSSGGGRASSSLGSAAVMPLDVVDAVDGLPSLHGGGDGEEADEYGEIRGRAEVAHLYLQMSGFTGEVRVMNQLFRRAGYLKDGQ